MIKLYVRHNNFIFKMPKFNTHKNLLVFRTYIVCVVRWIKYEEDVEEGANKWGKPHVSSLSFHSLLDLRKCIEQGNQLYFSKNIKLLKIL